MQLIYRTLGTCTIASALVLMLGACGKEAWPPSNGGTAPATTQTAVVMAPARIEKNFDKKVAALPNDFIAHQPAKVFSHITSQNLQKDKFESEAKYIARMQALAGTVLYDEVWLSGEFAFEPLKDVVSIRYDPEKQQFKWEIRPSQLGNDGDYDGIELERRDSIQNYPTLDAAYAERGKKISHTDNFYLQGVGLKGLGYINGAYKAKPELARALDGQLAVLFVGRIPAPYAGFKDKYPIAADDTVFEHQRYIRFAIDGVWLVNKQTGEVLTKTWAVKRY